MCLFLRFAERFGDELIYELVLIFLFKRSKSWRDSGLIQLGFHDKRIGDFVHLVIELLTQVLQPGALRDDLVFHIAD